MLELAIENVLSKTQREHTVKKLDDDTPAESQPSGPTKGHNNNILYAVGVFALIVIIGSIISVVT